MKIYKTLTCCLSLIQSLSGSEINEMEIREMPTTERVIEKVTLNEDQLQEIVSALQLTIVGSSVLPKDGRIATNLVVPTAEEGQIMIRIYPKESPSKLETGFLEFEIEALKHLGNFDINIPRPIRFQSGDFLFSKDDYKVFAYKLLKGENIPKEELSEQSAHLSGTLISKITPLAIKFNSSIQALPAGDLEYIEDIYIKRATEYSEVANHPTLKEMLNFNRQESFRKFLASTPKGIVHADFFFENFLIDENNNGSLIDFGDAYYGHVVMDIAIGAMEFSAVNEDEWNFKYFERFLVPNIPWLKDNDISGSIFIDLMRANCLRFAVYTAPFTLGDKEHLDNNPYVRRFKHLGKTDVQNIITEIFNRNIK